MSAGGERQLPFIAEQIHIAGREILNCERVVHLGAFGRHLDADAIFRAYEFAMLYLEPAVAGIYLLYFLLSKEQAEIEPLGVCFFHRGF